MRLTLVHPAIGRKPGTRYMRTWQMEPLPIAALAGLTPRDVEIAFYDDRMEAIGLARALPGARPPLMSLKGAVGHSLAAAGAVEAAMTLEALRRTPTGGRPR